VSPFLLNIQCVTFYYHMYGSQMGALNVYRRVQNTYINIFHVVGNQGKRWHKGTAYFDDHAVKVGFRVSVNALGWWWWWGRLLTIRMRVGLGWGCRPDLSTLALFQCEEPIFRP